MDPNELFSLLHQVQTLVKKQIHGVEHMELIMTIPHDQYVKLGQAQPMMVKDGEPFLELGAGESKIIITSAEALGLSAGE